MKKERKTVRLNSKSPSPYLRDNIGLLMGKPIRINGQEVNSLDVADLGCGNGRNSIFMMDQGCKVASFDMQDDFGTKLILGQEKIPLRDNSCDIVLLNYIFMFLAPEEIVNLIEEIKRIARKNCVVMVELYEAKNGNMPDKKSIEEWKEKIKDMFAWNVLNEEDCRFIAKK